MGQNSATSLLDLASTSAECAFSCVACSEARTMQRRARRMTASRRTAARSMVEGGIAGQYEGSEES
ncbi:unnamed protein product [Spirodela intermedia]|uniref:Uncharacterized protein n=2 Tax=Spirodela intermedia TaxID=51605 RepID=A0A7I8KJU0_SPIIN|nr:unnamed protein product [Spirodela intermedia]